MNIFEKAKATPIVASPKSKLEEPRVKTPGLEIYAYADALEKQLAALKKSLKANLTPVMVKHFLKTKGENYKGEDKSATASLECRKRASNSALEAIEIDLLKEKGISTLFVDGDYKINPAHAINSKLMKDVAKALEGVKGLPQDFIQFDAKKKRTITTDQSIDEVFRLNDEDTIKQLLPIVGVFSIKAQTATKIEKVFSAIEKILTTVTVEDED